ncbi:MBL fold metallo-hydrolase [Candidatus Contubernalis alkaliaceticus]|uniref:MBL fold metallo-hydrolase n=1 Tax=Candidatus Contubernalis alkaliaceticus TaxID=338645 RepID=UPI001F4BD439|nr:MBL fold metallo-hydrolase [Candidatus Contubernalis alkalaceticus]UNC91607.1 MBL fold metallo-hydrolase [Candidatus Contubernalis alkalaceticus]
MSELMSLGENFYVFKSSYWELNSGIMHNEEECVLIDPGYSPDELGEIDDFLKEQGGPPGQSYLIYTHSDFDHIVGGQQFPLAKEIAQENFLRCFQGEQFQYLEEADKERGITRLDFRFPVPEVTFKDSLEISLKNETLALFAAPGHTRDSLFVVLKNRGVLLSGDTLSDQEFPFIHYNAQHYKETLQLAGSLLEQYDINFLVPGHGNWTGKKEEMKKRVEQDIDYLDNLMVNIREYYCQGLATAEIHSVLREVRYKGDYIGEVLMPEHTKNIEKVIQEIGDNL